MTKFPKYLVEMDFDEVESLYGLWPSKPLWVARLRNPFCLARVELDGDHGVLEYQFWPMVIDADREQIADKLCRALLRDKDISPDWFTAPKCIGTVEPPEFIHMHRPGSDAEFVLEPHAPRLWRLYLNSRLETSQIKWWKGFGKEPNFPDDTRRVADFIHEL